MTDWQGAMALFKHEMRRSWYGLLFTLLIFIYVTVVMTPLYQVLSEKNGDLSVFGWSGDFIYLSLLPNMGFVMSKARMRYWKNDSFTRKLAYWRTMPIGLNSIVLSRMLQLVTVLTAIGLFFFVLQYMVFSELRSIMNAGQYTAFALTWIGYALTVGATYTYFEQTCSGKMYLIVCMAYIALYAATVIGLAFAGEHVLQGTIEAARGGNLLPSVLMPMAGLTMTAAMGALIRKRLATRNLSN